MNRADYVLSDGASEMERLRLQARVWEAETDAMLEQIGVAPGWRCADLGCGAMGILGPLSRRVGAAGRVVGTDTDSSLLMSACGYVEERGIGNVELVTDDAYASSLKSHAFDLVHARFLICPCGRGEALLKEMTRLAKPGGVIALQEPDPSCWNCYPDSAAWDRLKGVILRAFEIGGGDFGVGRRAAGMLRGAGCVDVQVRPAVLCLSGTHPYKRLPVQFIRSLRRRRILDRLISEAELDQTVRAVEEIAADPTTTVTTFIVMQAWGRVPRG